MLEVYSFDPGLATGFAYVAFNDGEIVDWRATQIDHEGVGDWIISFIQDYPLTHIERVIVCESFTMTMKKSQSPWSLEAIGLLRYASLKTGVPLEMQQPAAAKSLIRDAVIKAAGMWQPGKGHDMDAVRHALYYLMTKRKALTECLKADVG